MDFKFAHELHSELTGKTDSISSMLCIEDMFTDTPNYSFCVSMVDVFEASYKFLKLIYDNSLRKQSEMTRCLELMCKIFEHVQNHYIYFPYKIYLVKNEEKQCVGGNIIGKSITDRRVKIISVELVGLRGMRFKHEITSELKDMVPKSVLYESEGAPFVFTYIEVDNEANLINHTIN